MKYLELEPMLAFHHHNKVSVFSGEEGGEQGLCEALQVQVRQGGEGRKV